MTLAVENELDHLDLRDWSPAEKARLRWRLETDLNENPRPNQLTPPPHALCPSGEDCAWGPSHVDWDVWLMLAGRGFGKTRSGAEDVADFALKYRRSRIALVAATFTDGRDTMVEGESGLLSVIPASEMRGGRVDKAWNRSIGELFLRNGSRFRIFASERPDRLRGPQHHRAWADEPSVWNDASLGDGVDTTWNNLMLGLRLPVRGQPHVVPQVVATATPKAVKLIKELVASDTTVRTSGSTYDNAANLAPAFRERILARYEGTATGRQELHGELLEEVEGALWKQEWFARPLFRVPRETFTADLRQRLRRAAVGVDPAATSGEHADDTGIVVAGKTGPKCPVCKNVDRRAHYFVWRDATCHLSPAGWGALVAEVFDEEELDAVVAEINNGGEMVTNTMHNVNDAMPVVQTRASKGKHVRAQPISALYEQGRVHHVDMLGALEGEYTTWDPEDLRAGSPDRMDAAVWVLWWLSQGYRHGTIGTTGSQIADARIR